MVTRRDVATIQEVRLTGFTEGLLIPLYSSLRGTESELTVTMRVAAVRERNTTVEPRLGFRPAFGTGNHSNSKVAMRQASDKSVPEKHLLRLVSTIRIGGKLCAQVAVP